MIGDWLDIGWVNEIPVRGSRTVTVDGAGEIAVFRTGDDNVFALRNRCPHKGGPLSQGIVHGHSVACPLHNWNIALATGEAQGEDKGCTPTIPVKVDGGRVLICRTGTLQAAA
ncbi:MULTISPECIES: nitrite reductase small subunit NirD [unclassified Sphingobium]|uniref:nitrite reductase small subunit NirD n=1 Tax=unclassified Sphingobium TaxID=2611147 RepID=UPI00222447A4|nr:MULTISPECIES: nitrite reductase small subunit NirD [unclassified Sphingobium]MCW2380613.1 nitrite reductase (NADH) small subunit [Sphingobium sp. B2D3B]MCW2399280.1 nitrite reductase (NADH) small subunit [Sphingobium sp. B2D3C]